MQTPIHAAEFCLHLLLSHRHSNPLGTRWQHDHGNEASITWTRAARAAAAVQEGTRLDDRAGLVVVHLSNDLLKRLQALAALHPVHHSRRRHRQLKPLPPHVLCARGSSAGSGAASGHDREHNYTVTASANLANGPAQLCCLRTPPGRSSAACRTGHFRMQAEVQGAPIHTGTSRFSSADKQPSPTCGTREVPAQVAMVPHGRAAH